MKKIKLTIFAPDPENILSKGKEYFVDIDDNSSIIDVVSLIDKEMIDNFGKTIFPLYKGLIHSYLQLIWDAEENKIYDDCGLDAYGPNKEYMPLRSDVDFSLIPDSEVIISVHVD